jgi:acyl-CoA reductase-like NAD-dependent aldehyde dehydrogenase
VTWKNEAARQFREQTHEVRSALLREAQRLVIKNRVDVAEVLSRGLGLTVHRAAAVDGGQAGFVLASGALAA